jgi:hypothetical protein
MGKTESRRDRIDMKATEPNDFIKKYLLDTYGTDEYTCVPKEPSSASEQFDYAIEVEGNIVKIEDKRIGEKHPLTWDEYCDEDIWIELIQNQYDNAHPSDTDILRWHTSLGWFYKTNCDRFIYTRRSIFQGKEHRTGYDIAWKPFKRWVLDKILDGPVRVEHSTLTTGSLNVVFDMADEVPHRMFKKWENITEF